MNLMVWCLVFVRADLNAQLFSVVSRELDQMNVRSAYTSNQENVVSVLRCSCIGCAGSVL